MRLREKIIITLLIAVVGTLLLCLPVLAQTGSISGRVTNADGRGVSEVLVIVYDLSKNYVASVVSDSTGKYVISNLAPGSYKIWVNPPSPPEGNYLPQWYNNKGSSSRMDIYLTANVLRVNRYPDFANFNVADIVSVIAGRITPEVNITLARGGQITGNIASSRGGSVFQGTPILVYDLNHNWVNAAKTDDKGNYMVSGLPVGYYKVMFGTPAPFIYESQWYNGKASFETADLVSVSLGHITSGIGAILSPWAQSYGTISGRVINASWQVIPNATIRVDDIPITFDIRDGHFIAGMIPVGIHTVYYDAPGYISQTQVIEIKQDQTIQAPICLLSPITSVAGVTVGTGEIFGRVVNQSQRSIPRASIQINNTIISTNPRGKFRFTLVHPGIYTIYYDAPGYRGQTQIVEVKSGQTTRPPTVIMDPGITPSTQGEIYGKVVNQAHQPIALAAVRINNVAIPTNAFGEFRFHLVKPGVYIIYYDATGYGGQTQVIEVKAGMVARPPMVIISR